MAIYGYTPKSRSNIGGAERLSPPDRVLRVVGHRTENIVLTPAGADVSAGQADLYDVGSITKNAVGRYMIERQTATDKDADPLGVLSWMLIDIHEETAGVFEALEIQIHSVEKPPLIGDFDDENKLRSGADMNGVVDPELNNIASDSRFTVFIARAADVTDAAAWATPATLVAGNLYLMDSFGTTTRKYRITRVS